MDYTTQLTNLSTPITPISSSILINNIQLHIINEGNPWVSKLIEEKDETFVIPYVFPNQYTIDDYSAATSNTTWYIPLADGEALYKVFYGVDIPLNNTTIVGGETFTYDMFENDNWDNHCDHEIPNFYANNKYSSANVYLDGYLVYKLDMISNDIFKYGQEMYKENSLPDWIFSYVGCSIRASYN